ncbi:MAG: endonuclease/exonuclease/phosphatase family protein [Roseivivax sp.]|nr:endonuclease/exonuclease/phosphatase family protein [Roseivivax sp.]MCB1346397.1 endonuclease/exonuclease/phosphatase family protein [Paracoccaceae bacterium]
MRALVSAAGLLALVLVGLGLTGARFAPGDSLAVVRVPLALLAALTLPWARPRWLAALGTGAALLALAGPVAGMLLPAKGTPGPVAVYQKNVLREARRHDAMVADILARASDVVTLQEVTSPTHPVLTGIAPQYPVQHWCRFARMGGVAVASRWPMVPGTAHCMKSMTAAAMQVQAPGGPLWVVSMHLRWPWPAEQAVQVRWLEPELKALAGPLVMAGDFNMLAWGASVRRLAQATGTERVGPVRPTYWVFGALPLGIDHAMSAGGGTVELLPRFESDHNGLLARLHPGKGYGD